MNKIHLRDVRDEAWTSPKGRYGMISKEISVALGRDPASTDAMKRHPFDVELCRLLPGLSNCPYHSHSAQWEFYHVVSGAGAIRDAGGATRIEAGDSFVFPPGEAHQVINDGTEDLLYFVIADNPLGDTCHYPDSGKWLVRSPERRLIRSEPLDYYDGEE